MGRLRVLSSLLALALVPAGVEAAGPTGAASLTEVVHALEDETLVVSGRVRNIGQVGIARIVVDAWGYTPSGEVAGFGSDSIPWTIAPGRSEPVRIFFPLGRLLIRTYQAQITDARPPLTTRVSVTRTVAASLYRPYVLARVRLDVDHRPPVLVVSASSEGLPIKTIRAKLTLLVQDHTGAFPRLLLVDVPAGGRVRLALDTPILRVVAAEAVDVSFAQGWGSS